MTKELNELITILVPTYNRLNFLTRLINYYISINIAANLHVLDSSSETEQTAKLIQNSHQSNIHHQKFESSVTPIKKLAEAIEEVKTPFVVLWADDDFLTQSTFTKGVDHLLNNEFSSAVHGESALFIQTEGQPIDIGPYRQRSYENHAASQRLIDYLSDYSVLIYSVQRTSTLSRNLHIADKYEMGYNWGEIILGCLSVIQGKVNKLPHLHMVREAHPKMDSWATSNSPSNVFEWVSSKSFSEKYAKFEYCVAQEVARYDKMSYKRAREITSHAFSLYLKKQFQKQINELNHNNQINRYQKAKANCKNIIQSNDLGKFIWTKGRSLIPNDRGRISLANLLQAKSPHHKDFEKIYLSIQRI